MVAVLTNGMPPPSATTKDRAAWLVNDLLVRFPAAKDFHCAACVGNLWGESTIRALQEAGQTAPNGGFGWAQWTADRRIAFAAYCRANGDAPTDDEGNYGYLLQELTGSESHAWQQTLKTTTLEAATETFMLDFERPGDPAGTLPARISFAKSALDAYRAMKPTPAPSPTPAPQPAPTPAPAPPLAPPAPPALSDMDKLNMAIAVLEARIAIMQAAKSALAVAIREL